MFSGIKFKYLLNIVSICLFAWINWNERNGEIRAKKSVNEKLSKVQHCKEFNIDF